MSYIDYILHFSVIYMLADWGLLINYPAAIGIIIIAAVGKELYDKYHDKEQFDVRELMFGIAGGFVKIIISLI